MGSQTVELHVRLNHFHRLFDLIFDPLLNQSGYMLAVQLRVKVQCK